MANECIPECEGGDCMCGSIERRIREYEDRYGIATDEVHAAIDAGRLDETLEVCNWIMDAKLLRHVRQHG